MATALTNQRVISSAIESALIHGDLKTLDAPGRLEYYNAVCKSLGLNPLTRPFEYIVLNGKLTLYARRDCAEQLRKIHGVTIQSMKPEMIGDLLVVTVSAMDKTGRQDSSTGAVPIKGLQGENLANAMMKAETKAKRRVTLSLCGLGLLDETEVEGQSFAKEPPLEIKAYPSPNQEPKALERPSVPQQQLSSGEFRIVGNHVTAKVLSVVPKKTKGGKDYRLVTIDGEIEGSDSLFCYHASLFPLLESSVEKVCQFEWEKSNQWISISLILDIDGQEYRDGVPFTETLLNQQLKESLFNDEDIPQEYR